MTKVLTPQYPYSLTIRKRFGRPIYEEDGGLYGAAVYARGEYGGGANEPEHPTHGIYQMRHCIEGYIPVQMKFYRPANPNTEAQQTVRAKMADAVSAWQALTDEQKESYNLSASGTRMTGYNLFCKQFLLS